MSHDQFDTLVGRHHGEIYRYLLVITGRMTDADDLSEETFLRAFTTAEIAWACDRRPLPALRDRHRARSASLAMSEAAGARRMAA